VHASHFVGKKTSFRRDCDDLKECLAIPWFP